MEINVLIKELVEDVKGNNSETGNQWHKVAYLAEPIDKTRQLMVIDLWDGRDGRIARLNIQPGKRYRLNIDYDAVKYKDKWYNKITAWNARLIEDETEEADNEK